MNRRLPILPTLPKMKCDVGCGDCCGPVPVTPTELAKVKRYMVEHGIEAKNNGNYTCPFYDGRCRIYSARPLLCRVFGHTKQLECTRGYNTNVLPDHYVRSLVRQHGKTKTTLHSLIERQEQA